MTGFGVDPRHVTSMSSNDNDTSSNCTNESHSSLFLNLCALGSDSSSSRSTAEADPGLAVERHSPKRMKSKYKYSPTPLSPSPTPAIQEESEDSPTYQSHRDVLKPVLFTPKKEPLRPKKASVTNVNLSVSPLEDADDEQIDVNEFLLDPDNRVQLPADKIPRTNAKRASPSRRISQGVLKHRGRRYKPASAEKLQELNDSIMQNTLSVTPSKPSFQPRPPPPTSKKTSPSDNLLKAALSKTLSCPEKPSPLAFQFPDNTLSAIPPSIDIIAPSPTLSSQNSAPTTPAQTNFEALKPNFLSLKSTLPELISSGSSSGSISPSGSFRLLSAASTSSTEGLPPLRNTPVLRRKNLLPPIFRQDTLSPSSCSTQSRSPSPNSKLGSPSRGQSPASSDQISPTQAKQMFRSNNSSPLLQYVMNQQSLQHYKEYPYNLSPPGLPHFYMKQESVSSNEDKADEARRNELSKKRRKDKRLRKGESKRSSKDESTSNSTKNQADLQSKNSSENKHSLERKASIDSLDAAPRSPDEEPPCISSVHLPTIKTQSKGTPDKVRPKFLEHLSNDLTFSPLQERRQSKIYNLPLLQGSPTASPSIRRKSRMHKTNTTDLSLRESSPKRSSSRDRFVSCEERLLQPSQNTERPRDRLVSRDMFGTNSTVGDLSMSDSPIVVRRITQQEHPSIAKHLKQKEAFVRSTDLDRLPDRLSSEQTYLPEEILVDNSYSGTGARDKKQLIHARLPTESNGVSLMSSQSDYQGSYVSTRRLRNTSKDTRRSNDHDESRKSHP